MPLIKAFVDEGEDLELVWFAGFVEDAERGWLVRVVTRGIGSGRIKAHLLPLGLLPILKLGQCFRAGDPAVTTLHGTIGEFTLPRANEYEEVASDRIPPDLFMVEGVTRGVQRLLRYRIDDLDVLVPAVELVRYLFLHNKTLANALMQPGAIMELFRPEQPGIYERLHLQFTRKMPVSALTKSFVAEFAWIAIDPDARHSWDSVAALSVGRSYVTFRPPRLLNCKWKVVWEQKRNSALVLEILHIAGRPHPCGVVCYSHPSIRGTERFRPGRKETEKERASDGDAKPKEIRDYVVDDHSLGSRIDVNQAAIPAPSKLVGFSRKIEVMKIAADRIPTNGPGSGGRDGGSRRTLSYNEEPEPSAVVRRRVRIMASVADDGAGHVLPPVEFRMLEPADSSFVGELTPLLKTIQFMQRKLPTVAVATSLYVLKEGRAFSATGEHRRPCLIALFHPPHRSPMVLIEVDHSGGYKLSSLLLTYREGVSFGTIEENVKALLDGLVDNSGSWNTNLAGLSLSCTCIRLPKILRSPGRQHENSYCWKWAMQLIDRFGMQDLVVKNQ